MAIYEVSWTIDLQTNDESALEMPFGETALTEMYPSDRGAPANAEGVNIHTSTDGGRQGRISVSQRVTAGNAQTARRYLVSANAFASQRGMEAVINNSAIDVTVSLLTVVDTESGISVVTDSGRHVPDVEEVAPTARPSSRRRRGRPARTAPIVEETTTEETTEEETTEEEPVVEETTEEEPVVEETTEEEEAEEDEAEEDEAEEEEAEEEEAEEDEEEEAEEEE